MGKSTDNGPFYNIVTTLVSQVLWTGWVMSKATVDCLVRLMLLWFASLWLKTIWYLIFILKLMYYVLCNLLLGIDIRAGQFDCKKTESVFKSSIWYLMVSIIYGILFNDKKQFYAFCSLTFLKIFTVKLNKIKCMWLELRQRDIIQTLAQTVIKSKLWSRSKKIVIYLFIYFFCHITHP